VEKRCADTLLKSYAFLSSWEECVNSQFLGDCQMPRVGGNSMATYTASLEGIVSWAVVVRLLWQVALEGGKYQKLHLDMR